jgi:branched-chain amino acid transport system permease protein
MVKKLILAGASIALIAILPIFIHDNAYYMNILILSMIWGVMATSWDLILGYAGVFSFGHLSFFVIGAYTSGLLGIYLGVSPWIGMVIGGLACAVLGVLIGIPCLRLQGMYLAIVTFSLQFILPVFIVQTGPSMMENFNSGGTYGLQQIPKPVLFGYTFTRMEPVPWFYLTLVVFILFLALIYWIIRSPIGLAFTALRDAEPLAKTLGVDDYKYKLMVFGISAFIAGMIGAYYGHYFGSISPATLSLEVFLIALVMMLFGGLGVFPGAVVGAFVITIVNELLRPTLEWRLVILGAIVVVTMIFMPKGLMGIPDVIQRLFRRIRRWQEDKSATPVAAGAEEANP